MKTHTDTEYSSTAWSTIEQGSPIDLSLTSLILQSRSSIIFNVCLYVFTPYSSDSPFICFRELRIRHSSVISTASEQHLGRFTLQLSPVESYISRRFACVSVLLKTYNVNTSSTSISFVLLIVNSYLCPPRYISLGHFALISPTTAGCDIRSFDRSQRHFNSTSHFEVLLNYISKPHGLRLRLGQQYSFTPLRLPLHFGFVKLLTSASPYLILRRSLSLPCDNQSW